MSLADRVLQGKLADRLAVYAKKERGLPGIARDAARSCLLGQLVESVHRVRYVRLISGREMSPLRINPQSDLFDPLKGAIRHMQQGETEEAYWFVFLFVHFGKHKNSGWRAARDVYAGPAVGRPWTWQRLNTDPSRFANWLAQAVASWKNDGVKRQFGNHRKYESLENTGRVVESYVRWVHSHGTHQDLIAAARSGCQGDACAMFDILYESMSFVERFGRTARFDYLGMVAKLGLAPIVPGKAYLLGATGPLRGARLLFTGNHNGHCSVEDLERWLVPLGFYLAVGQDVLEDALCNWQKSPTAFVGFRG